MPGEEGRGRINDSCNIIYLCDQWLDLGQIDENGKKFHQILLEI